MMILPSYSYLLLNMHVTIRIVFSIFVQWYSECHVTSRYYFHLWLKLAFVIVR